MSPPIPSQHKAKQRQSAACAHADVECLNAYELIRKYRCRSCEAIMMCNCEEPFARRFLSHQLKEATELKSQQRLRVTHGFQPNVCRECRGLPAEAAPHDEGYRSTSKIKRYYWRELWLETWRRHADWKDQHADASDAERGKAYKGIERTVLAEIKAQHAAKPKYVFGEPSQGEILERYRVPVVDLEVPYVEMPQKGAVIAGPDGALSPETFATSHFEAQGWAVLPLESQPFHALFGVMMWRLVQE